MEQEKEEIIDFSGEEFKKFSMPCSVGLLIILVMALVNVFSLILFPGTYISTYISLVIIFLFSLYYYFLLSKNPGKIRKFSISNKEIELIIPNKAYFKINWTEFSKLEIILKELNYKPFRLYEIHFINQNSEKNVYLSAFDFHKEKIDQILLLLKEYSLRMKKKFNTFKEKNISGVFLREDFKI
ncbi:MAG: hypothetical protein ACFFCY_12865 [Promethearchaeota archaeon]